jgi:hypothetical protein
MKYAILNKDFSVITVVDQEPPSPDPYYDPNDQVPNPWDPYDPYWTYVNPWYPDYVEITDQQSNDINNYTGLSFIETDAYGVSVVYDDIIWFDKKFYEDDTIRYTEQLKRKLAIARYTEEVSGLDVGGGVMIKSDRATQSILFAARTIAKENPAFTVDWKLADGTFTTLDATTIISAADGMAAFVQSLFTKEAQLYAAIDAAQTYEEISTITW